MVYRTCSQCGKRVPEYTLCKCEKEKKRENYRLYQERRLLDKLGKDTYHFYNSGAWTRCKGNAASHQFRLDLIEWDKGNIVEAETYHHIFEIKEDWSRRLDDNNIIGLTQQNHMRVHALMNRSEKDKAMIQEYLMDLLERFNKEYYSCDC